MDFASGEAADMWRVTPQTSPRFVRRSARTPRTSERPKMSKTSSNRSTPDSGPVRAEVPVLFAPVHTNEAVNLVIGDRTNTTVTAAAWPEVSRHRHAVWAGRAINGEPRLLVRVQGSIRRPG